MSKIIKINKDENSENKNKRILTYCIGLYQAAKYGRTEHEAL